MNQKIKVFSSRPRLPAKQLRWTTCYLVINLAAGCATSNSGYIVPQGDHRFDVAINAIPSLSDAKGNLLSVAFDLCRKIEGRGFKIVRQEYRGVVLLAKVECTGTTDAYDSMKFGSYNRTLKIFNIGEVLDQTSYPFSYEN